MDEFKHSGNTYKDTESERRDRMEEKHEKKSSENNGKKITVHTKGTENEGRDTVKESRGQPINGAL